MNFRLTGFLFVITSLIVTGLFVMVLFDDTPATDAALFEALANLKEEEIDTLELVRTEPTEQKLVFVRDGTKWILKEPYPAKIDAFPVNSLVRDLLKMKPTPYANLTRNLAVHGLDKPTLKVTLTHGSKTGTLNIGDTTIGADKAVTFVTTSTRPNVPIALKRSDLNSLFKADTKDGKAWTLAKWLTDYRDRRLLGGDARDPVTDLERVTLRQAGKDVTMNQASGGEWTFSSPAGYGLVDVAGAPDTTPDTYTGLRPLLNTLTNFQVFDLADFIEQPQPLETYGLKPEDPNVIQVELQGKNGKPELLYIGKKVEDKPGAPTTGPIKHYAKLQGDNAVIRLQTDRVPPLSKLIKDPIDLRDRTIVSDLKKDLIDALDITTGGNTIKLRKVSVGAAKQWVMYGGPSDPQFAGAAVQSLLDSIAKPRAAREILSAPYDAVFADKEVQSTIKIWYDGVDSPAGEAGKLPPEPKLKGDGKPSVTLTFGKKEGDIGYVRRLTSAGVTSDLKVPEPILQAAIKGRLDYIDLKLKSFATNNINKLKFNRGSEVFELVKDEKADATFPLGRWTYLQPARLKDQIADSSRIADEMLGLLSTQSASRIVTESPSEADLKKYGLDPAAPRLKITVTQAIGEPKELSYEFGVETEDKLSVYARETGRPFVFLVNKITAENFLTIDLRDRTLFRLDRAKVQKIQLKGWKQELKAPAELILERKAGVWTAVKAPDKLVLDPARVEQFVNILTAPRAMDFVPGQTPEQGFDMGKAANTLEIHITSEGGVTHYLTLGNEADQGLNYFAWSNGMKPSEVAKIPAATLRPFKEKPTAFAKQQQP